MLQKLTIKRKREDLSDLSPKKSESLMKIEEMADVF
jgi:hypothetical protein